MGTLSLGRGRRWLLPSIAILILSAGVLSILLAPETADYVGFFGLLLGLGMAVGLFVSRSRGLEPRERKAWLWVAGALASLWTGVLAVGGLAVIEFPLSTFSALDVLFLGGYAAMIFALYLLMRSDSGGQEWILTLVDALVGSIALVALTWVFVFHDLMDKMSAGSWWQAAIAIIYPIGDVLVVVALLILVLRRSHYRLDLRLMFLGGGAGFQVLADFIFLNQGIGENFSTAEPAWGVNLVATIFLVLAAAIVDWVPRKREFPEAPTPIWALMWPYFLVALLMGVHFQTYRGLMPDPDEVLLLDAVIAILLVILLRQIYVIYRDRNRVDRKRAELVASVSHELRTPLTAMVGFLTLLDDHPDEFPVDTRQEMISEAAGQARHMSRLVSDLLMLAKGDMSQLSLEVEETSAMSIVTSVLRATDASNTRIDQELETEVTVRVDPDRLKQALANLTNNAVRYGGDHVLVVGKVDGRDLILEVHDNGSGVPTRFESMIWQHFERGAHRLDASTPGLGIGLSIVQAVAESHGGRADYRTSERLGGACFSLTIPGCVVAEEPARSKVPAST
ncbi:MAG TPA: ATP-binding protein [Acidimicrobiia bacterium]